MSTWRDQLQPASFRGVPFEVDGESSAAGRRTQLHEFVQRDEPFVEDLGRKTRAHKVTAFVIGADCFQKRDALLAALDTPGPGELVHPWLGKLTVTAGECEFSHDRREGGMVRFELEFIESGDKGFPVGTPNTGKQLEASSTGLLDSALERYGQAMAVIDSARLHMSALRNGLAMVYGLIQREFSPLTGVLDGVEALADMLANAPGSLSSLVASQFSSAPSFSGFGGSLRTIRGRIEGADSLSSVNPAGGQATVATVTAAHDLIRDALLVQVAREAAAVPALSAPPALPAVPSLDQQVAQPVTRDEVPVADDVLAIRDAATAALWTAALTAPHEHFRQLEAVRKRLHRHLSSVAASGVRLVAIRPLLIEPAVVLAYRRFGDATRAGEIVTRNRIRHPGFVPPVELQVAQE